MSTSEFSHYDGCNYSDTENCSGCALTDTRQSKPNYAAWPLVYIENNRAIPVCWLQALLDELSRTDNIRYVENLKNKIKEAAEK